MRIFGMVVLLAGQCLAFQAPDTPTGGFKALLQEYERGPAGGRIFTDAERMAHIGQVYRHHDRVAEKLVALAERQPKDPLAVDGLVKAIWQVNTTPWPVEVVGNNASCIRAFELLLRDHLASEKLGPACTRLGWGFRKEYEGFLREVLAKSPSREVRGQACLALARYLAGRQQRISLMKTDAGMTREFADLFGKGYTERLVAGDAGKVGKEVEALLETALREYGDARLPEGELVSAKATAELFELRHLAVGCKAPEVEGEDQDGKRFRLSDYRGKVVLLDFWSEY